MEINSANLRTLGVTFSNAFQEAFSGVAPQYPAVSMTVPSTTKTTEYGWLGKFPNVREWVGDRVVNNLSTFNYSITNKKYETTIGVSADDIDDDNVGIYGPIFSELGRSVAAFPDQLVWPLLLAGFSSFCYDGQYFFDTDHPVLDPSGNVTSVANTDGGSGAARFLIDKSRAIKPVIYQLRKAFSSLIRMDQPTDEQVFNRAEYRYGTDGRCNVGYGFWQLAWGSKQPLTQASYSSARAAMTGFKADFGTPLGVNPNLIVVGPSNEVIAKQIVNASLVANAAGTAAISNVLQSTADVLVVPWLP